MIGYDPPANSTPNPNDPQAGDATVDAGIFYLILNEAVQCGKGFSCQLFDL